MSEASRREMTPIGLQMRIHPLLSECGSAYFWLVLNKSTDCSQFEYRAESARAGMEPYSIMGGARRGTGDGKRRSFGIINHLRH